MLRQNQDFVKIYNINIYIHMIDVACGLQSQYLKHVVIVARGYIHKNIESSRL